ncbi:MAG: ABC transporter ATP-binding protein [Candidatus Omnitrophica bacterium]|nr:ABC transporter ATP-binding protein [Candidatus Omnitrophota bacterium]
MPVKVVEVKEVTKDFYLGKTVIQALWKLSINVEDGEFIAIAGPSGSGKTTLLNLIGCIDNPTSGTIKIDDVQVNNLSSNRLAELRASKIGFIFQSFNLIPVLSGFENVEYPLLKKRMNKDERKKRVTAVLENVGLEKFIEHRPDELSGGQRQRVAIARALVSNPKIILADEPTANLDHSTGIDILNLMKKINKLSGTTFIFSTHDPKIINIADRIINLFDGQLSK